MSLTYPTDTTKPLGQSIDTASPVAGDEPFVPVYARRGKARGGQGKIKTWMILTPVGVAVLAGIGFMMVAGGEESAAPLVEPAQTPPVLAALPTETAAAPLTTSAAVPEPVVASPVLREAAPAPRPSAAPVRRQAAPSNPAPRVAPRVATPAPVTPTGPQPYAAPAGPTTSTLNAAPATPAATTTPTPPVIIVEPVG